MESDRKTLRSKFKEEIPALTMGGNGSQSWREWEQRKIMIPGKRRVEKETLREGTRIFQYISNRMQRYTVYLYLETALHISGGISTHHQEHTTVSTALALVKPLLLPAAIVEELELQSSSNGLTSAICCRYSCVCSWWWVKVPPETCRAVSIYK